MLSQSRRSDSPTMPVTTDSATNVVSVSGIPTVSSAIATRATQLTPARKDRPTAASQSVPVRRKNPIAFSTP